jgi:DNA-binding NarL/FixJ family response regulator
MHAACAIKCGRISGTTRAQAMAKSLKNRITASPKEIFIVEDHPTFREGLVQILDGERGLHVCGQAATADQALKAITRLKPDLVLVDISLPAKSGLELIKELRSLNQKPRILAVSMHDEAIYAARVLRAGGDGYIMKQEDTQEIVRAIRDVLAGHIYVSEIVLAGRQKAPVRGGSGTKPRIVDRLTDAELEVLELLGRRKSAVEIARQLRLTAAAVSGHCSRLTRKLGLKGFPALVRYAIRWVEAEAI